LTGGAGHHHRFHPGVDEPGRVRGRRVDVDRLLVVEEGGQRHGHTGPQGICHRSSLAHRPPDRRLLYGDRMRLDFATFAARPDLIPLANQFPGGWHEFMYHDPVAPLYFDQAETTWAGYALIATDAADPTRPVARAYSVPFDVPADPADLPPDGWDRVVLTSALELAAGRHGAQVSALEITI